MTVSKPGSAARSPTTPTAPTAAARHRWLPRQHGGWAMLLLPFLLGIAASRFDPWQLVLACVALSGYVASATYQAWARARRPVVYRAPLVAWGGTFVAVGLILVGAFPVLLGSLVVLVPASLIVLSGARPGVRRGLANSLAQVAQALVLVPAAAVVSGRFDAPSVWTATGVAAVYLVGTVLVVRSVLGERSNPTFALLAVGFHALALLLAVWLLPMAYALVAAWLALRAVALPTIGRRRAGGPHPLRPIQVGIVEMVSSVAVVVVSFVVPV